MQLFSQRILVTDNSVEPLQFPS